MGGVLKKRYLPIDKNHYDKISIHTDNLKVLKSLDLSKFNAIDLDAYGVPFKQLEIIFNSKFKGIIYFTFIQTMMGGLPKKLLLRYGITEKMYEKTKTLFSPIGFNIFKNYLAQYKVDKITYINPQGTRKYYGFFYKK